MESKAKKKSVTISNKNKEYKINQFGKLIVENWCQYAQKLIRQEREKKKKIVQVSTTTDDDKRNFEQALERLREIREEQRRLRSTYTCAAVKPCRQFLKKPTKVLTLRRVRSMSAKTLSRCQSKLSVKSTRSLKKSKSRKSIESRSRKCPATTKCRHSRSRSKTRSKSAAESRRVKSKLSVKDSEEAEKKEVKKVRNTEIHYPAIKRKTWIPPYLLPRPKPKKPVVIIPPFKRIPWDYCKEIEKTTERKEKPKIVYPPLTLRQP